MATGSKGPEVLTGTRGEGISRRKALRALNIRIHRLIGGNRSLQSRQSKASAAWASKSWHVPGCCNLRPKKRTYQSSGSWRGTERFQAIQPPHGGLLGRRSAAEQRWSTTASSAGLAYKHAIR